MIEEIYFKIFWVFSFLLLLYFFETQQHSTGALWSVCDRLQSFIVLLL